MRSQRTFFRRNRRGNVAFVAGEQYLREDLPCGLQSCRSCEQAAPVLASDRPLLVLEAGVLEAQLDLFRDGLFGNCVVPLSALHALERSGGGGQLAREARATIASEGRARGLFVFCDVHHQAVQVPRQAGEAAAAHHRQQAEAVAAFYRAHAAGTSVIVVSDAEEYARQHAPQLLGRVAWVEGDDETEGRALFAAHLSRELLDEGLQSGRLRECRFYDTCVEVTSGDQVRLTDANRALPGDRVAVDGEGRVVGILSRRAGRALVGTAHDSVFVGQDGQRVQLRVAAAAKRRLVCVVDSWPCHRPLPLGHIASDLGELHSAVAEQRGVLLAHEVRSDPFTPEQLSELPPADTKPGLEAPWREDLRHLCVASVDPPGCTDIDDALHARVVPGGLLEVGVHIADVATYVREGSAMDEEAKQRSTTVYLVDRRIDMLPERLSGHLCSLVSGGVDRHAMSVIWTMNEKAEIVATRFCRSLIRSRASLTYAAAQAIVDEEGRGDELAKSLRLLQRLARLLRERRVARGALLLSSPEVKFVNKSNNGVDAVDVEMYQSLETNSTVEEFMLLANICVANKIWSAFPSLAMLRRHAPPAPDRWAHLLSQLAAVNVFPKSSSNADVAAALETAPEMARVLVTRYMQQAVYLCSSSVAGVESFAHYGLAVPIYTHFTSPIRRYADIVVHRLLAAAIGVGPIPKLDGRACERVARHINHRHRMAQLAGRASAEVHSKKVLREQGARTVEASVLAVLADGRMRCMVASLGLEVLLVLRRPRAVLETLTLRLSIQEGSDSVDAVEIHLEGETAKKLKQ